MTEYYNQIFFYGNKVLKLDKEKDIAWFNAYTDLCKAHFDFVMGQDTILYWTGSADSAGVQAFLSGSDAPVISSSPAQTQPATQASSASSSSGPDRAAKYRSEVCSKLDALKAAADAFASPQISTLTEHFLRLTN